MTRNLLLIIADFITNIIPQDEEETLSNQGQATIMLRYKPKKPKLQTVTVQQWVIILSIILHVYFIHVLYYLRVNLLTRRL